MITKSSTITNLAKALSAAQGEFHAAKFDSTNPFLKNKFASLGSVIEEVKPVFTKHGLAVSQFPVSEGGQVGITTILTHASGEWMENTITLPLNDEKGKSAAQVAGSIITYLRRYSLAGVTGLYADEDTDGSNPGAPLQGVKKEVKPDVKTELGMTLETALTITNSEGVKYGDVDTAKLAAIANNAKAPELKRTAAKLILASRSEGGA